MKETVIDISRLTRWRFPRPSAPLPDVSRPHAKWVIEPVSLGYVARFEEVWRYRKLLWFFGSRAITERYEGTTLGIFWLFARPAVPLLITTFVFGSLLHVASDGLPYILFFLGGISCWRVFERSMMWVTSSLEQNRGLMKKVYVPRLIAPISSVAPALLEFVVLVILMLVFALYYRVATGVWYLRVGPQSFAAPLALVLTVFFAISLGLWTSVLQVRSKDVRFTIRYVMQFWLYLTPVIYPMSALPAKYHFLIYINPMAPLVDLYKWATLGIGTFPALPMASSFALTLITFASGLIFFDRSEAGTIDQL